MQDKVIATIAVVIGLALGGCALLVWYISKPDSSTTSHNLQTTTSNQTSAAAGSALPTKSGATTNNPTANSTQTQNRQSTSNQQSGDATLDPKQFSRYDKYANDQTASFATISEGSGAEAEAGKKVSVNYRGWLTNGQIFDENVDPNKPFSFTLGSGQVIRGWDQGIAGMRVGGERLIIIPPAVGYGSTGNGPIPGNAVLVFDVKVVAVE